MRFFMMGLIVILGTSGCSFKSQEALSKRVKINGLICPEGYSQPAVEKDLTQCHYYEEKKAAEASHSPLKPACVECLEAKGYEIE